MNILLLSNSHLPSIGGKEIVQHHLAYQMQRKGHNVRLAGPAGFWSDRTGDLGYQVQRVITSGLFPPETMWRWRLNYILRNHRYDIIHAHVTHPAGYHAQQYLQQNNDPTPLIVTPHGADIHKVPEVNFGKRLDPELDAKIRWLLQQSPLCTAISDAVETSLLDAGAVPAQIRAIPNGVDTERFEKPRSFDIHNHLGIANDTRLFVSVGNYHPRKGHEFLIDAVAQLNDSNLHVAIVGRTDQKCIDYVAERNLKSQITFTGQLDFPVPGSDTGPDILVALLHASTGYISSSMGEGTEGLSLALLEAMAAHVCPIATNVSGNRDVVVNNQNGYLVEPGSADALAAAMHSACASPEQTSALGRAAANSIAHLSWSAVTDQYIEVYRGALADRASTIQ